MATRPHDVSGVVGVGDRPLPITEVHVRGFRCFEELHVAGLTRVNLILGRNNSGKTSLLEAVEVAVSGDFGGLIAGPARRGERPRAERSDRMGRAVRGLGIVVAHLFHGRRLASGARFEVAINGLDTPTVTGDIDGIADPMTAESVLSSGQAQLWDSDEDVALEELSQRRLALVFSSGGKSVRIPLDSNGAVELDMWRAPRAEGRVPVKLLGARNLGSAQLVNVLDGLASRAALDRVLDVVKVLEPRTTDLRSSSLGELGVALEGEDLLVPLGSLGDGFRYLLGIALHLESAADGVLLIDEIDTGLHYSVLSDLWRLVIEGARRLNVQVFATTHSRDCIEALGAVIEDHPELASDASAHRIDVGYPRTVRYAPDKLATAARRHIEVR